jgi:hypothetical protein
MANVNVDDRGTRSGSIQTGLRDLLGRDRQRRVLIRAGQVASDGASENGFIGPSSCECFSFAMPVFDFLSCYRNRFRRSAHQ